MEEINEILQQEETKAEKHDDKQDNANMKETREGKSMEQIEANQLQNVLKNVEQGSEAQKVIPMAKGNRLADHKKEEKQGNDAAEKAGKVEESQKNSSKKMGHGSKPNMMRPKSTIPKPFAFETEKRMSRERTTSVDFSSVTEKRFLRGRFGSMDVKDSQPQLAKSISLNYKAKSSPNSVTAAAKPSSRPKVTTIEHINKRTEVKTMQEKESDNSTKLHKSSTFKETSFPSVRHRKIPPSKPETKKTPITRPKSPVMGQRSRSLPNNGEKKLKVEEKGKKTVSKTINGRAKETISKFLKTTKKAFNTSRHS